MPSNQVKSWDERAQELIAFYLVHGHFQIPARGKYRPLYRWTRLIREWYNREDDGNTRKKPGRKPSSLTQERVAELNALQFPWKMAVKSWDERAQELVDFHRQHGHFQVPGRGEYSALYHWMRALREWYDQKEQGITTTNRPTSSLTPERVAELNTLKFPWKVAVKTWDERAQEVLAFQREHGHFQVPASGEYQPLYEWMVRLREWHEKKEQGIATTNLPTSSLTQEREAELDALQFPWKTASMKSWDERAQELIEFHRQHGHFQVPGRGEYKPLYDFTRRLREWRDRKELGITTTSLPSSSLTQERVEELTALKFNWDVAMNKSGARGPRKGSKRRRQVQKLSATQDEDDLPLVTNNQKKKRTEGKQQNVQRESLCVDRVVMI